MGFPGSDRSRDHHIVPLFDILATGQFENLGFGDASQRLPIDLIQGFPVGKTGLLNSPLGAAVAALIHFRFKQLFEKLFIGPAAVPRLTGDFWIQAHHGGRFQLVSVFLDHRVQNGIIHGILLAAGNRNPPPGLSRSRIPSRPREPQRLAHPVPA